MYFGTINDWAQRLNLTPKESTVSYTLVNDSRINSKIRSQNKSTTSTTSTLVQQKPLILYWTKFFSGNLSNKLQPDHPCPYKCRYSSSRADQAKADARIFHIRDFNANDLPVQNPNAYNKRRHILNFIILARSDPTQIFTFPYDAFVEQDGSEDKKDVWTELQIDKHIDRKLSSALAAISNCHLGSSGRNNYIKELKKYINVTQVGRCSKVDCDNKCLDKLIDSHHFYLAFENSVCPEYTTEKFWRIKKLIVPIVLSRGAMHPSIPSDSYIAASDFESPRKLAIYLSELVKDKEKYKSYFNWTKHYRRTIYNEHNTATMCQLCKLITKGRKRIKNYTDEWNISECIQQYGDRLINNRKDLMKDEAKLAKLVNETSRSRLVNRLEE
ncbi:Glyco-tran-10-N domain-containing protein [Aphelenchoides bicaudatus]|nr:Glyco-tran-10-N domain-containing protein [Aphelenchoides bicaudatus]